MQTCDGGKSPNKLLNSNPPATRLQKGAKKVGEIIFASQKQQYVVSVVAPLASLREFQNEHMS